MLDTMQQMRMSQVLNLLSTPIEKMTGPELRRCRELMGLSVLEVSNKTGIPPAMMHVIEAQHPESRLNQTNPIATAAMLKQLADLYRIPIQRPTMPWEKAAVSPKA